MSLITQATKLASRVISVADHSLGMVEDLAEMGHVATTGYKQITIASFKQPTAAEKKTAETITASVFK